MFLKQQAHLLWACEDSGHGSHARRAAGHSTDGSTECDSCAPGETHVLEPQAPSSLWALGTQIRASPQPVLCPRTPRVCQEEPVLPQASPGSSSHYLISQSPSGKEQKLKPAAHPWRASLWVRQLLPQTTSKSPNFNMPLKFGVLWVAADELQRRL